jgi:dipeptidyl aminopeptidase/acylaminoacyl peptidase
MRALFRIPSYRAANDFPRLFLAILRAVLAAAATCSQAAEAPAVYRERVDPHWFANGNKFWYRVTTGPEQHEFVLVDAEKGTRQAAFDASRLVKALQAAGVTNASAERLPLEGLEFEDTADAARFEAGGKNWRCDLTSYALTPAAATNRVTTAEALPGEVPRASRRTGEESGITFINHSTNAVELFWLDTEGERRSYGKLAAGQSRDQHTFAGHVWLAVDPAGKTLAAFEAQDSSSTVEITDSPARRSADASAGRRRRGRAGSASNISPDQKFRVVLRDYNLHLRDLATDKETAITTNGTEEDAYSDQIHWSPDSHHFAVLRTKKGDDRKVYIVESSPRDQLQPKLQSYEYLKPGDAIPIAKPHLFDAVAGKEIPVKDDLFTNAWSITDLRWSPDSSRFTFLYNQRGHQVLRIVSVDAATGQARAIVDERSQTFIDYSGKQFSEYLDATKEIIWMSERDGWNHLYLYDANTGRVKNQITRGPWVVRGVERVDPEAQQIWFRAGGIRPGQDPYYIHYCRVNFDGTGLVILTEGDGTHTVRFSPDRRFILDSWSRVDQAPIHELRRTSDGRLLCALETPEVRPRAWSSWRPPERFVAKGRDGETDIYGLIHRPADFDPARKYPVIESIYAGPQDSFVPKNFHATYAQQRLANRGYIVVQMDGMGTSNRSKKFHDVCWKNLGDAGFPDRIAWLKAAAAKYPSLDLTRVGIYGTSAGGQSALRALLAFGDFYQAAVADSGCHDNRMDKIWWNEQWMGWPVGPHYAEQSNVTQAHRLQGKLLLMAGELDRNVDPASTMQVVNALIKANKDFELLIVPGAGHGILGSPYGQHRLEDFFERNLKATK